MVRALAVAVVALLGAGITSWAAHGSPADHDVAFVVALRTFESQSAALADQAAAQSTSPVIRAAGAAVAADATQVAGRLWALLDQWDVAGVDRLPQLASGSSAGGAVVPTDPTGGLRHACALVTNDELGRLAVQSGAAFDQSFVRDWIGHAQTALLALASAPPMPLADLADRLLRQDVSRVGAALATTVSTGPSATATANVAR